MVRFKNRYLLLELQWSDRPAEGLSETALTQCIRESLQSATGNMGVGSAMASLQVKYYNPITRLAVVRCDREAFEQVWLTVSMMSEVQHRRVKTKLVQVAGTSESCRKKALLAVAEAMQESPPQPHLKAAAAGHQERLVTVEL